MITSRAELMRRLEPGTKLKVLACKHNPAAVGRIKTITKKQTQDIVFEPSSDTGDKRSWQAIPPVGALRFIDNGFAISDYRRNKSDRYEAVPNGDELIVYEFVTEEPLAVFP